MFNVTQSTAPRVLISQRLQDPYVRRLTLDSDTNHRRLLDTNWSEIPRIDQLPLRGRFPLLIEPLRSSPTEIFDGRLDVWYSAEEVDAGAGGVTEECLFESINIGGG